MAWNNAVIRNTAAAYREFLVKYPDSDLTATARKLELRLRNRPDIAPVIAGTGAAPQNVALTCPCSIQPAPLPQLKLTPTGGVDLKNAGEWIKAGAACIGVGSALVSKEALAKGDWASITNSAKAFVDAVKKARNG